MTPEEKLTAIRQICEDSIFVKMDGRFNFEPLTVANVLAILDDEPNIPPEPLSDKVLIYGENIFRYDENEGAWKDVLKLSYSWRELVEDLNEDCPIEVYTLHDIIKKVDE